MESAQPPVPGPAASVFVAFLTGAAVLSLEITGARAFVPWYGSSVLVWSNVIGVTLGAIACGNLIGGRLAERGSGGGVLACLLVAAGMCTAACPWIIGYFGRRYIPGDLPLDTAFALMGPASLVTAIAALGPALLLLGAATPVLIRGAARRIGTGRAAGWIGGAGTLGSLAGTWLPVYVLVPEWGSRATLIATAGVLGLAAAVAVGSVRKGGGAAASVVAACLLAILADGGATRAPSGRVLAEIESRYQYIRVEQDTDPATGSERVVLRLNEGLDSFHSITVRGRILTGAYFDAYPLYLPLASRAPDGIQDVLILGFAAGTIARQLVQIYGEERVRITGVELDPAVAGLGPRFFDLPRSDRIRVISDQDARTCLAAATDRYDLIIVDTYADQVYVPFQMCSREFFALARGRLRDGGVLAANLSGFSLRDAAVAAIVNTACSVFSEVRTMAIPGGRNFVLGARSGAAPPDPRAAEVPDVLSELRDAARRPGACMLHRLDPAATVLTDDRSPIELLADRDLRRRAELQLAASREATR